MSAVAFSTRALAPEPVLQLGPGRVTAVLERELEIELLSAPRTRRWARLAVPSLYRPQVDDVVLTISGDRYCYVIGVLEARGPSVLEAPGDLDLRAPHGTIRISAARSLAMASPLVEVRATDLELGGDSLREEFTTVRRTISGMLEVRAKAICIATAETCRLVARRLLARGEDSVAINAPSIDLG